MGHPKFLLLDAERVGHPPKKAGAAKAVDGYENPLGRKAREGSSPSARTNFPFALASKRLTRQSSEHHVVADSMRGLVPTVHSCAT